MKPNFVAKRSAWNVKKSIFWGILLFFLIIPLISMIIKILETKKQEIQFFDNKIVLKSGLFNTKEKQSALTKILSVSINRTFWGRIFNYGNLKLDVVGKGDLQFDFVKNPDELKKYIESIIAGTDYSQLKELIHD